MNVLAISYMLPPMLYPQAIQIGRLIEGCGRSINFTTVSGIANSANTLETNFGTNVSTRYEHRNEHALSGFLHKLAMKFLPLYGRCPDEYGAWANSATSDISRWLEVNRKSIDVLVTFGEPMSDHLIGLALKSKFQLPWVAHFSDPWADNPFRAPYFLSNIINSRLEARVCEFADSLIFTSDETRRLVMKKYPKNWLNKCYVLPHSFNNELTDCNPKNKEHDKIVFRYLGNFYGHRTPFPLINSILRIYKSNPEIFKGVRFELVGEMAGWMKYHPAIRRVPGIILEFMPQVPYNKSIELMSSSDALIVIDAPSKESVFLPSKLVDYIGAGREILGIVPPGTSSKLIIRLGGAVADPSDPEAIDRLIIGSIKNLKEKKTLENIWGDQSVRSEYEVSVVAKQFIEILKLTMHSNRNLSI